MFTFPARVGLGTWKMGESRDAFAREVAVVREALQLGYRLIDTAEMYGDGGAESVVGQALREAGTERESLCIVSKVLPHNASRHGTIKACEASLQRLGCEYLDVYLLHWAGHHPFTETLQGFAELKQRGLVRHVGVSNLDVDELLQWQAAAQQLGLTDMLVTNQVHYCLSERGIEFDLLPWQRLHGVSTMAYSPLGLGDLAHDPRLRELGAAHAQPMTAAQVALAWGLRYPELVVIPKTATPVRLAENLQAAQLRLTEAELAQLDSWFPAPRAKQPLAMI